MLLMSHKKRMSDGIAKKLMGPEPKGYYEGSMSLGGPEPMEEMGDEAGLESAAAAIIRMVDRKDVKGLASALKDFFLMCDESEDAGEYSAEGEDFDSPYAIGE